MEGVPHLQDREWVKPLQADVERLLDGPAAPLGDRPRVVLGAGMGGTWTVIGVHTASNVGLYIRKFC